MPWFYSGDLHPERGEARVGVVLQEVFGEGAFGVFCAGRNDWPEVFVGGPDDEVLALAKVGDGLGLAQEQVCEATAWLEQA